jgi:hypothetical protein
MTNKTKYTLTILGASTLILITIVSSSISIYYMGIDKGKTQNQSQSNSSQPATNFSVQNDYQDILAIPSEELSQDEKDSILFMREEEKLARDVYLALSEKHNIQVFRNISSSEQTHMDTMKTLIDKYNLTDSMKSDQRGDFNNPEFTKLYNDLVKQGSESQIAALKVGATIEDLDIRDINERLLTIDNQDVRLAFEKLRSGSENHMRAFVKNLKNQGSDYTPQFISITDYEAILASSNEQSQNKGNQGGGRMGR